jgi:hypothetical protein
MLIIEIFDVFSNRLIGLSPPSMSNMKNLEEVYLDSNDFSGKILRPTRRSKTQPHPMIENNICSLKKLKIFSADCARTKTHPAEIECACCTRCCNDHATPRCIDIADAGSKIKKRSNANSKTK